MYLLQEVLVLPASKRIIITVSENLLYEVDEYMVMERKNRSEVVRDAIKYYLGERKRELMMEQMKRGYLEMAEINLGIANENNAWDEKEEYEKKEKTAGVINLYDKKRRNLFCPVEPGDWFGTGRDTSSSGGSK
jgi:CopG family transcriptional regulator/antitoxin EndoAI